MSGYEENKLEELKYLEKTVNFLKSEIDKGRELIANRKKNLINSRRDMWENTAHHSEDFEKMTEVNQHLIDVTNEASSYLNTLSILEKYEKIVKSPYFARFDFVEDGFNDIEKIYVGLHNVMDLQSNNILIYDWRAPVSSIFYQNELGRASYKSPVGDINGEVSLKRQYRIKDSVLKYFFDCSVNITDELLQEVLSHNASAKMKNIVETIQKEQDIIIRDVDNELLTVQGVAGSGKTSVALHRIAFLLYHGAGSALGSNNIIIISPNSVFSKYISSVLPELGEENVCQATFDDIIYEHLGERFILEKRSMQLESIIGERDEKEFAYKKECIEFKGSQTFVEILRRLVRYYERQAIPVEDVSYAGTIIESKQEIKSFLLNNKVNIPLSKHLRTIENRILEKLHPLQKKRLERIEKVVANSEEHQFEKKIFSRLLSIKETNKFMERLHRFTEVDYFNLYLMLFDDNDLLVKLTKGFKLPGSINRMVSETRENLKKGKISYEDCAPLVYLKLILEGSDYFSDIRQVVIDEAQDYYFIHYVIFKTLFPNSKYTVLGDINQTIERDSDKQLYETVEEILQKRKYARIILNKSYRSSCEINLFNQKLLNKNNDFVSFERHEEEPEVVYEDTLQMLDTRVAEDVNRYLQQGYESIAVICRTQDDAEKAYEGLNRLTDIRLVDSTDIEIEKGAWVIPSYISKGLEFDVVLVYGVSKENYSNEFDRKLLYIACTRSLHRLLLYYTGEKSPLL